MKRKSITNADLIVPIFHGLMVWLVLSLRTGAAAPANPAGSESAQSTPPIPWNELGVKATAQYSGDGLAVNATADGARLLCVFQKLEGEVTPKGLWLSSPAHGSSNTHFRVLATSLGRERGGHRALSSKGTVETTGGLARFIRPGLIEEYSVSVDGLRQDFVLPEKLPGEGALRVELKVAGATAEASSDGAHFVLEGSGRKLNYHRLRATDATGRELAARMEVSNKSEIGLAVIVEDSGAAYPVRVDPTFSDANWMALDLPGANGTVLATVVDASGNLYIGGQFSMAGGVTASNIAKWNGSSWSALGTGTDTPVNPNTGGVFALAASGNDLYAGGYFTTAGGVPATNIAKWNGSSWSALGSGLNGGAYYQGVLALAMSGGNLYAGGNFTSAGDLVAIHIAKWNGTSWSALGTGMNNYVAALAVSGNNLYAGGGFTVAGAVTANRIAKWNGSSWSALGSGLDYNAVALAVSGSDLYVGGGFTTAGSVAANYIAKWNGHKWSALGSGLGDIVTSLAVSGGDLFAAGYFTTAGGVVANRIAKWNGSSWSALSTGLNRSVRALAVSGGNLYAGGNFTTAGGKVADYVAKWNGTNWSALGAGTNNFWIGGTVGALAVSGSNLYAGVDDRVAKWDGSSWSELPGWTAASWAAYAHVYALAVSGNDLYAGGEYLTYGFDFEEYYVGRVSKWNGTNWSPWGEFYGDSFADYPSVNALAVSGSNLYAGGVFSTADGAPANNIAKWNESGWSGLGAGMDGTVYALTTSGSDLYAGGIFTNADGVTANHVAKWNGSSWSALGSGMDQAVFALAASGSDLYAGGAFTTAGSTSANRIAKWNGSSWSALGSGITDNNVYALAIWGGDLYVGGDFTTAGGGTANRIAKWDGSSWSALGSGMDGLSSRVYAIAVAGTGAELYAGGWFTTAGGKTSPNAARASLVCIPPLLSLTIRLTAPNTVAVSWPSAATGFVLQQNTNGLDSVNWSNATGTFQDNGTSKFIVVNPSAGKRFYRLVKP